jgi:hypothetical protein
LRLLEQAAPHSMSQGYTSLRRGWEPAREKGTKKKRKKN